MILESEREVAEGGSLTKVICQYGIPHRDMAGDSLVEAAVGEQSESSGQVLLSVLALLLERIEFRVRPDVELPAVLGLSHDLHLGRVLLL